MSTPHPDAERLTLAALPAEQADPEVAAHLRRCAQCRAEVDALRRTVELARAEGWVSRCRSRPRGSGRRSWTRSRMIRPAPVRLWDRRAGRPPTAVAEDPTGAGTAGADRAGPTGVRERARQRVRGGPVRRPSAPRRDSPWWRRRLVGVAAAAVVGLGLGVGIGWARPAPATSPSRSPVQLGPVGFADPTATGTAAMVDHDGDQRMVVELRGVTNLAGGDYLEAWLMDSTGSRLLPLGALARHGEEFRGEFTIPAGLPTGEYDRVDVSAERLTATPGTRRSACCAATSPDPPATARTRRREPGASREHSGSDAARLSAVERRRATLAERGDALPALRVGRRLGDRVRLRVELRGEAAVLRPQQPLRPAQRPGRPVGEPLRERVRLLDHLVVRHHRRDQPPRQRLVRVEHPVGEQDVPCAGRADGPRQRPGQSAVRGEPDRGVRRAQPRRDPATATSAATTRLIPAPAAQPRTAATTGTGTSTSARTSSCSSPASARTAGPGSAASEPAAASAPTSAPTQKCGPSPTSSTAPTSGSSARSAAVTSRSWSKSRVPCRAALLTAQRSTRPVRVTRRTAFAPLPVRR